MSLLYVAENGSIIGVNANRIYIKYKDGLQRSFPIETVDGISILGISQLTTKCMEECMRRGIPVSFFSKGGRYFGRLMSTGHIRADLQRKQSSLYDKEFALNFSKKIIQAKIRNQQTVLRRYAVNSGEYINDNIHDMHVSVSKIVYCDTISEIMGYEGQAAKRYYEGLSRCIDEDFKFNGRSRRPPKDEFNSLISLGYSILMNEIYCEIEMHGLNPYFGFMHRDSENHPTQQTGKTT